MANDEDLAARVREALAERDDVVERAMFGGLAFMVRGHMCCGVVGDDLVLRLGAEGGEAALDEANTRPMDFTGRPMAGFVYVASEGLVGEDALRGWLGRGLDFVSTLPPK